MRSDYLIARSPSINASIKLPPSLLPHLPLLSIALPLQASTSLSSNQVSNTTPKQARNQYRTIMPLSITTTLLTIILGPFLFPHIYTIILLSTFAFTLLLSTLHLVKFLIAARKIIQAIARGNTESFSHVVKKVKHTHVFILPNFGESVALLSLTLSKLAAHSASRTNYVLVLAMEQSESDHLQKSQILADAFREQFNAFVVSVHPANVRGEARGKGSNVNYASRHIYSYLTANAYNLDKCIVTVMDSDSHIHEQYIREVEHALATVCDPLFKVFCPPIFLGRNPDRAVRLTDTMWSCMVIQNLENLRAMIFPCSTYSLSMRLAESVGFWDAGSEAVGEDMHMMMKCYFQTAGRAKAHPIYIPINLTNVQTEGYFAGIYARYTQAKRHYFGSWDVSYALTEFCKGDERRSVGYLVDGALVIVHALEAHLVPTVTGLLSAFGIAVFELTSASISTFHLLMTNHQALSPSFVPLHSLAKLLGLVSTLPVLLTFLTYHILHYHIEHHLFKQKSVRQWWHIFDFGWLFMSAFVLCVMPSCVSGLRRLFDEEEVYIVSKKDE